MNVVRAGIYQGEFVEPGTGTDAQSPPLVRRCGAWARFTAKVRPDGADDRRQARTQPAL